MSPEQNALPQSIAAERARLFDLMWQDIVALSRRIDESHQRMEVARPSPPSGSDLPAAATRRAGRQRAG